MQVRVPPQVPLFWRESLFLATADGNSLTTWTSKLLATPETLPAGVRQAPRGLAFLLSHEQHKHLQWGK